MILQNALVTDGMEQMLSILRGEIVEQISFVYSMFTGGLNKVQKGVEFNGEIIPLDTIKKTKISS